MAKGPSRAFSGTDRWSTTGFRAAATRDKLTQPETVQAKTPDRVRRTQRAENSGAPRATRKSPCRLPMADRGQQLQEFHQELQTVTNTFFLIPKKPLERGCPLQTASRTPCTAERRLLAPVLGKCPAQLKSSLKQRPFVSLCDRI